MSIILHRRARRDDEARRVWRSCPNCHTSKTVPPGSPTGQLCASCQEQEVLW